MKDNPASSLTIRTLIEKLRSVGAHTIYTKKGNEIVLLEIHCRKGEELGRIKVIDGKPVFRQIFCAINGNIPEYLNKYSMYIENGFFRNDEYIIPERVMNEFLNDVGIDVYRTLSAPAYMLFG